jgi:NADH pyrophosphatase NudC (nudix superfamily)
MGIEYYIAALKQQHSLPPSNDSVPLIEIVLLVPHQQNIDRRRVLRCPYCVEAYDFLPMIRVDGLFICSHCGHTTNPQDSEYWCECQRCAALLDFKYSLQSGS